MEKVHIINTFVKMFLISCLIYLTYEKISNYKNNNINYIIIFFIGMGISTIFIFINKFLPSLFIIIILYIIYGFAINKITENKWKCITYIYSCVISYLIYIVATIVSGVLLWAIGQKEEFENPISLIIIPCITVILFYLIFKIKRFKNGFNFLKKDNINKDITVFAMFLSGIVLCIYSLCQKTNSIILNTVLFIGAWLVVSSLIIWIKSQITKTYKSRMRDRTIEMQKTEIDEQTRIMDELKTENLKLASAIHKYNKKFSALEFAMKNAIESGTNTEFANEISVILEETKEAAKNFAKETQININKLPLTNNVGIDNMFKYMQEEARKKDINLDLKLNTSINPLLENIISKDKFETLIGDHLKDAIIAVEASSNSYKSILATLGVVDGIYEFSVYDTGIEFEIDTLLKLGKEQITTHKEEGGSGIGFMTTFETLKECKASLIIEEYNPETTNYTKAVVIRFDGKNQYKIYSYRAEEIKKQNKGRKISIKQLR